MNKNKRLGALNKFKARDRSILIATDVASRGLDIPHVDIVVNLDIPTHSKDYIHRVGRTARAGRSGKAYTFVSQYDVELFLRIEQLLGHKIPVYEPNKDSVMVMMERVTEAQRIAKLEMSEAAKKKGSAGKKRSRIEDEDDTEEALGVRKKLKTKSKTGKKKSKHH